MRQSCYVVVVQYATVAVVTDRIVCYGQPPAAATLCTASSCTGGWVTLAPSTLSTSVPRTSHPA